MIATRGMSLIAGILSVALLLPTAAFAQDAVVARVNGKMITEADLKLADAEIGTDLGNLPELTKRRVLIEYLIENQLMADAAESAKLGQSAGFDTRNKYWRRRALRDSYFDNSVKGSVSEAEARQFYEAQLASAKPGEEVKARHILVESQAKAKEIFEKIAHGADFAQMAREFSKDPGTKEEGGTLGYFGRGQMVAQFEEAAFNLEKGDVSAPVQTQFGWHLIKVEDRRERKAPEFEAVKPRIVAAMIHRKAQEVVAGLRQKAKVEYVDPAVRQQIETEKAQGKR